MRRIRSRVPSLRSLVCAAAFTTALRVLPQAPTPSAAEATPASAAPSTRANTALPASQVPGNIPGTIFGTWQAMPSDNGLGRVVVRIAKNDDGTLHGMLIFIDRGSSGPPLHPITFNPLELSFSIANIDYRGRLSADTNSIEGTWTQGGESHPVSFARATPATLWTYSGPAPLPAMAADANPGFEVATIKPSRGGNGYGMRGHEFHGTNLSAVGLIKIAYNLRDRQVIGGPDWMTEDKFDITGEPDAPGKPSDDQMRTMVRKLLEDRFGLKAHTEQRDFAVYALTVDKPPAKVTPSDPTPDAHTSIYTKTTPDGDTSAQFAWFTMADLANLLMNFIQSRQIVDETGLKGQFDFTLTLPNSALHPGTGPVDAPDDAFARAIAPLGLKFVPKHESLEVIVVDHIDKPSAN